ncbi:MAG: DEAD/DEAH box helicase [Proteobacteria bacterium]|nr:DEAD/DEAH box helicase [Pseudomonadota bacterium]
MRRFVQFLKTADLPGAKLVHYEFLPGRPAQQGRLSPPLAQPLRAALSRLGITHLYEHQARAISYCRKGRNVVVATPTASGKSLVYNLALMELLSRDPGAHGLYLFPLKALAQDQLQAFVALNEALPEQERLGAAIYDGDTPPAARRRIKNNLPHLIISNPDMLHLGLLPYHQKWEVFFRRLRVVVVDEVHTYRGVFGSHIAQVFRRLRRVCQFYGSNPLYVLLSATISNPGDFASRLTGMTFETVDQNGAPQAGRHFFFVNPDLSATTVAARLFVEALRKGLKTIAFTQARKLTEILHMTVTQTAPDIASGVSSYRAGFLAEERREIEQRLGSGAVTGVISTSALEMGIDIGGLDACILVGYPGTIIDTWQRSGRVGRGGRESVVILIGQPDALDQYFMRNPDDFFSRPFEAAVVDPDNPDVLDAHLPCAAAEIPLKETDDAYGSSGLLTARASVLEAQGELLRSAAGEKWYAGRPHPEREVDIRSVGPGYTILWKDRKEVVGTSDGVRVFRECHPGAIYLHRGQQYLVTGLDLQGRNAFVRPTAARYHTRPLSDKETEILQVLKSRPVANFLVRLGRLRVTEQVVGYEKRKFFSGELLDREALDLPPQRFETVGLWIEIEDVIRGMVEGRNLNLMGGMHALEHALIGMFPLFALCDRNDIGGIAMPRHAQLQKDAIFVYDGTPGGVGLSARGFEMVNELLRKTAQLIASCACDDGCPSCIHSPKCGSGNKPLDKKAALLLVRTLLGEVALEVRLKEQEKLAPPKDQHDRLISGEFEPAVAYLDLETQRLADEVGGWGNVHLMKLAVAVLYNQRSQRFEVFTEDHVEALIDRLQTFDLLVGFNIKRFDYRVLAAYTPFRLDRLPTFDILQDIRGRLGFRLSLDHLTEQTLGKSKTADGVQAVKWFREGNLEAVVKYCRADVTMTRELFEFGVKKGYLIYQTRQRRAVRLPVNWNVEEIIREISGTNGD